MKSTVVTTRNPHPNAFFQVPAGTEVIVHWPNLTENEMKPSFDEMAILYEEWLRNPVGTQADFFKRHKWTRNNFFAEETDRSNQPQREQDE